MQKKLKLNGMFSECEAVNHDVRHGTVLGPLIFLLYVNDFLSILNTTEKLIQIADVTSMYCLLWKKRSLHNKVKEVLQKTKENVEINKLTLNTNKTDLIFISRNNSQF